MISIILEHICEQILKNGTILYFAGRELLASVPSGAGGAAAGGGAVATSDAPAAGKWKSACQYISL